jgi:organic radical activating enzyme
MRIKPCRRSRKRRGPLSSESTGGIHGVPNVNLRPQRGSLKVNHEPVASRKSESDGDFAITSLPKEVNPIELFRLPWTISDNGITWLEPTGSCNIQCDACFHFNDPDSEKTLDQIEEEIRALLRMRRTDCILIAGGEPLSHPRIVDITQLVRSYKKKPVVLTNGVALDQRLVKELKRAGAYGFSFHVDAHQKRPGWTGKNERELNDLRQQFADMVDREGGLLCAFILTAFPDTIDDMPHVVEWAVREIRKVILVMFSLLRMAHQDDPWDLYAGSERIDVSAMPFVSPIR